MSDYTPRKEEEKDEAFALPPVPYWMMRYDTEAVEDYGHACRAPLLAQIKRMETVIEGMQSFWNEDHDELENAKSRIAELEAGLTKAQSRGDNHWETLRSIRHIAKESGDLARIVQWVNDAGSGYTDTAENTLAGVMDERDRLRERIAELETENQTLTRECSNAEDESGRLEEELQKEQDENDRLRALLAQHNKEPTPE